MSLWWSCTNEHLFSPLCFSFLLLPVILPKNAFLFLSCLIWENYTFLKSHRRFSSQREKRTSLKAPLSVNCCSDSVTLVGCYYDIYVLPMKRPTLWMFHLSCALFLFYFVSGSVTDLIVWYPRVLLKCSQVWWDYFLSLFRCIVNHLRCVFSVQNKAGTERKTTPSNHTFSWLFKTIWWKNWRSLRSCSLSTSKTQIVCVNTCLMSLVFWVPVTMDVPALFLTGGGLQENVQDLPLLDELNSWVIASLLILACFLFQLCLYPS